MVVPRHSSYLCVRTAFVSPVAALIAYALVAAMWLIPDRRVLAVQGGAERH